MKNTKNLSYRSIAKWISTGFFLGNSNFFKNNIVLKKNDKNYREWYRNKKNISFQDAVDNFKTIFETRINKNVNGKKIILPLSGGLDSRTIATALRHNKDVVAISYEFEGGLKETNYAEKISNVYGWEFHKYVIKKGYLWDNLSELANITNCETEFTHPRQMAVINKISNFGEVIISGQWGDVLFDSFGMKSNASIDDQIKKIMSIIIKPGGFEAAEELWKIWGLEKDFTTVMYDNIKRLLKEININEPNSRIRAFKSLYWAPRWSDNNLKVFSTKNKVYIPYYEEKILNLISELPENFLVNRNIQINYIKNNSYDLAMIPWQQYDLNLYQYKKFNSLYFPRRVYRYSKRIFKEQILKRNKIIQRNWELQFIGKKNEARLKEWLFETDELKNIIPIEVIKKYYTKFKRVDPVKYSHPISMFLTLAVWSKNFWKKK